MEMMLPKYRHLLESTKFAVIDAKVLSHQIPGGMISNLMSQLREADALDRLNEVLEEIPRTRKELGYPPLVTPMSQMVGSQSVSNVLFGRYKMISGQVQEYCYGMYGKPPAAIDPEIAAVVLKDYAKGQTPITGRPADTLEPELQKARDDVKDISTDIDDVLIYALYPTTGMRFLRMKHGMEPVPDEMKPGPPRPKVEPEPAASEPPKPAPPVSAMARTFNVFVDGRHFEVQVDPTQGQGMPVPQAPVTPPVSPVPRTPAAPRTPPAASRPASTSTPAPAATPSAGETPIASPMPGILLRYLVQVGQAVTQGDPVLVLEAMKMENTLPAPVSGTVRALPVETGTTVSRGTVLAVITQT
jgi:pyruvate carboxylase subunit B